VRNKHLQKEARYAWAKHRSSGRVLPKPCEDCGQKHSPRPGETKLHAHHEDYAKPLEVVWLCPRCHRARHMGPSHILMRKYA